MKHKKSVVLKQSELSISEKILVYILLIFSSIIFLFPILWMITTSLKDLGSVYIIPPQWIPNPFQWDNYITIFSEYHIDIYLKNTIFYSVISVITIVLSSTLVAFGFARLRARGSDAIFALVLSTMMLPPQVTMIPQYLLFKNLGWIDSYLPLIIPTLTGSAFIIFLLRQFYLGISKDLDEAVKIDGGGYLTIYARIILPLSLPALGTAAIMEFMYRWNELLGPLIYLNATDKYPFSLGLSSFTGAFGTTQWPLLMAAAVVAIIPPLFIFFFAQKYLIKGIVIHASKG